jgi:hypothetical protein
MFTRCLLDSRTPADYLADADRFAAWAERIRDNRGLSAALRRLANDARMRADAVAAKRQSVLL